MNRGQCGPGTVLGLGNGFALLACVSEAAKQHITRDQLPWQSHGARTMPTAMAGHVSLQRSLTEWTGAVQLTPSSTKGRKAKAAAGAREEHFLRLELKEIILIVILQINAAPPYCAAWCLSGEQKGFPSPALHWQKRGEL